METRIRFVALFCFTLPRTMAYTGTGEVATTPEAGTLPVDLPSTSRQEIHISAKVHHNCTVEPRYDEALDGCVETIPDSMEVVEYHLQLLLYSRTPLSALLEKLQDQFWKQLRESLKSFVHSLAEPVDEAHCSFSVGEFVEIPNWWQKWNYSDMPIYFSNRIQVNLNSSSRIEYGVSLLDTLTQNISLDVGGKNVIFEYVLFNGTFEIEIKSTISSDSGSVACCSKMENGAIKRNLTKSDEIVFYEMACPRTILTEGEGYLLGDKGIRVLFETMEYPSEIIEAHYTFHGHDTITLCTDIYHMYYRYKETESSMVTIMWWVTSVLFGLSLLGLFATFVTYCLFPCLRTVPGKINMGLIFNMFLAIILRAILESLGTDTTIRCPIIGVLTHYFQLSYIFWTNVCSYHVFKVFVLSKTTSKASRNNSRTLLVYCLYANGLPAAIVATILTKNLVMSKGRISGYDRHGCFLSGWDNLAFSIPISWVILSNLVVFVVAICTISRTKQVRRNTGGNRKNVIIYLKLSSIMGFYWITFFLSFFLNGILMENMFILLYYSQGVFVFFSFCVNRQVLDLWRRKFIRTSESQTRKQTSTIRITSPSL